MLLLIQKLQWLFYIMTDKFLIWCCGNRLLDDYLPIVSFSSNFTRRYFDLPYWEMEQRTSANKTMQVVFILKICSYHYKAAFVAPWSNYLLSGNLALFSNDFRWISFLNVFLNANTRRLYTFINRLLYVIANNF